VRHRPDDRAPLGPHLQPRTNDPTTTQAEGWPVDAGVPIRRGPFGRPGVNGKGDWRREREGVLMSDDVESSQAQMRHVEATNEHRPRRDGRPARAEADEVGVALRVRHRRFAVSLSLPASRICCPTSDGRETAPRRRTQGAVHTVSLRRCKHRSQIGPTRLPTSQTCQSRAAAPPARTLEPQSCQLGRVGAGP
jgi:hypothetical protein